MALYHKWDVKNGFAYVLHFFSLISDGLGGVCEKFNSSIIQLLELAQADLSNSDHILSIK